MKHSPIIFDWPNISLEKAEKELDKLLAAYREEVARFIAKPGPPHTLKDFETLDDINDDIQKTWSPVGHIDAVVKPAFKEEENERLYTETFSRCLQKLSDLSTEIGQNEEFCSAIKGFSESDEYKTLSNENQTDIKNSLRCFRLSGVDLPDEKKARFKHISARLTDLAQKFRNNISNSSKPDSWSKLVTDETELAGLPVDTIMKAREQALSKGKEGYLFYLGQATYIEVLKNSQSRDLRHEFYEVWSTRASDRGPTAGKWDNTMIVEEILMLEREKAQLLGFKNYPELALQTRMAKTEKDVLNFLYGVLERVREPLARDVEELSAFAREKDGIEKLEPWDLSYYFERLTEEKYSFSEEEVRKYFPAKQVLKGVFAIVEKLYGVSFTEKTGIPLWHADAKYFELYRHDEIIGGLYTDLYERAEGKHPGAWMDVAVGRRMLPDGSIQLPVGYLNCNFSAPVGGKPSLLTSEEVITTLHELGHNLQHLLTVCTVPGVAGINGVPWDGVEIASQFMEYFFWNRESIDLLSGHYETGEKLPDELFQKMLAAKNFGQGYSIARQRSFGISDFRLFSEYDPAKKDQAIEVFSEVNKDIFPMFTFPEYKREACSFSHIFGGGYSAGYYSYLWAEVISSSVYEPFVKVDGTIDWSVGARFLDAFLSKGGSEPCMDLVVNFRGSEPSVDALLRSYGLIE